MDKFRLIACSIFILNVVWNTLNAQQTTKPNIIYILADDMGIGDVKIYDNNCKFPTPNIDKMAKEGIRFTDTHTSSSVCTPTRYGILTGRYAWRTRLKTGVTQGFSNHLIEKGRTTVASYLKSKGYATAMVGKWHLGMDWTSTDGKEVEQKFGKNTDLTKPIKNGPNSVGFDYYFGISASLNMAPHAFIENENVLGDLFYAQDQKQLKGNNLKQARPGWAAKGFQQDEVMQTFTDKTIGWMEDHQKENPQEPFFVYLPLNAPHSPIVPSDKFKGKSRLAPHGDFCMDVDDTVGQIIKAVEALGISENTLIVFTADNGVSPQANLKLLEKKGHYSSSKYRGVKGTLYEGGHRVPFVVKWPKEIKKGQITDYLSCTTDLLATVYDIAGDKLPDTIGEDSKSFLPVLKGKKLKDESRNAIVHHSDGGYFSIRKDKWKLVFHEGAGSRRIDPKDKPVINPGELQLFNMEIDEVESTNVALENPKVVIELKKLMATLISEGRSTPGKKQESVPFKKNWSRNVMFNQYLN